MRASEHTLRYNREASCFNEALPLGNGRIGAMVYGGVQEETIFSMKIPFGVDIQRIKT